jgi:hypothetical protein
MSDFDDFRKDHLDSLVRDFQLGDEIDSHYLGRIIFDQVLQLGWTPTRFDAIDSNLRSVSSVNGQKHEGFAQKYIWMAFRQLVGRISDRYALDRSRRNDGYTAYLAPLEVLWHDSDL